MTDLSSLPPDEASALKLLAAGNSPELVADALSIEPSAVLERALRAADQLAASESVHLAESERLRVLGVVIGTSASDPLIKSSPAAAAYQRAVNAGLGVSSKTQKTSEFATASPTPEPTEPVPTAKAEAVEPRELQEPATASIPNPDRRRGMVLLSCLGAVIVATALAIVSPWGDTKKQSMAGSGTTTTQSATDGWQIRNRFTLKAVDGGTGKALAGVETKGQSAALLVAGNGLPPKSTIGIWLIGGGKSGLVGFQTVNAKGQFSAVGPLPQSVQSADTLVVTSETAKPGQKAPSKPGPVILSSPFSLT